MVSVSVCVCMCSCSGTHTHVHTRSKFILLYNPHAAGHFPGSRRFACGADTEAHAQCLREREGLAGECGGVWITAKWALCQLNEHQVN